MNGKIQDKKEVYRKLSTMQLFIPCIMEGKENISLELLVNSQRQQMIPAFLSKNSKKGNFSEASLVQFTFTMLRNILIELPREIDGIVIEPFGENIMLDRKALSEYDSLTQGMTVEKHNHLQNTTYYKSGKLPNGLAEAISRFMKERIGVNAVWVLNSKNESEIIPHLTFAIDYFGSKFDLFPPLAELIRPFMQSGQSFELIDRNSQMAPFLTDESCIYCRYSSMQ